MLGRDLVMVPKLIHPLPPSTPRTPHSPKSGGDIDEEPPTPHPLTDTWMQVSVVASHAATAAAICTEVPVGPVLMSDGTCLMEASSHCTPVMLAWSAMPQQAKACTCSPCPIGRKSDVLCLPSAVQPENK